VTNEASYALSRLESKLFNKCTEALAPVARCTPSLLHGDLWIGNAGANRAREPLVFDPAVWYGHDEFDLSISTLFGHFNPGMLKEYHRLRPRKDGFLKRQRVYRLFHLLNHLNLHGAGFGKGGSSEAPAGYLERVVEEAEAICKDADE